MDRRQRAGVGGDVGLAVELEDQRYLAGVVPVELLGQADLHGDAVESTLDRELDHVPGVGCRRVGEEVAWSVLQSLVVGEEQGGTVAQPVPVQDPVQPSLLPDTESELIEWLAVVHVDSSTSDGPARSRYLTWPA